MIAATTGPLGVPRLSVLTYGAALDEARSRAKRTAYMILNYWDANGVLDEALHEARVDYGVACEPVMLYEPHNELTSATGSHAATA